MTVLKRGSVGPQVKELQEALDAIGSEVDDDGIYGPKTEAAVRALQAAAGLSVDGIAGPDTIAKLTELAEAADDEDDDDEESDDEESDDETDDDDKAEEEPAAT